MSKRHYVVACYSENRPQIAASPGFTLAWTCDKSSEVEIVELHSIAYGAQQDADTVNPFALSAAEGGLVSAAIIGCWAAGFAIKSIVNVINGSSRNES